VGRAPYVLERTQVVPRPRDEVFRFFSDAANLETITPAFVGFRIVTPQPIVMRAGTLLEYRLRLFGLPFSWQTRIERWEPPARFVDVELRGPYALWEHTHEFEAVAGDGTRMHDRVRYALPLGPLGRAVHALVVRRTLDRIFAFRHDRIEEIFG
jgi:ligand-binding SRPBCC domain-containing protein